MLWENLTAENFRKAVEETGVCIVPMGVLEKHSDHLPLGTDMLVSHLAAELAAEKEPAVVFPYFYYGQIYEARCFPGTITIRPQLLLDLIISTFDEIGRNGFKKIIIHNGHGGNWNLIDFIAQAALWERKPYSIYVQNPWLDEERRKEWDRILDTKLHGHACECESSIVMAAFPELVDRNNIPKKESGNLKRTEHLTTYFSGIKWYAGFPEHYAGDASAATAAKGKKLLQLMVDSLADFTRKVKDDMVCPALENEFYGRVDNLFK